MESVALKQVDNRMHLVLEVEIPELVELETIKPLKTKCGIEIDSCNYENYLLTGAEEIFFKHLGECCAECSAEILGEIIAEESLGG